MPATANSKSRSSAACGIAPPGDMVDGDTSIGLLRGFSAGFFDSLVVRLFTKKPIAELAKMTSTPPTEPYRAISHRLLLGPAAILSARNWAISASEAIFSATLACSTSCLSFSASRFASSVSSSARSASDLALSSSAILLVDIAKSACNFSMVSFSLDDNSCVDPAVWRPTGAGGGENPDPPTATSAGGVENPDISTAATGAGEGENPLMFTAANRSVPRPF